MSHLSNVLRDAVRDTFGSQQIAADKLGMNQSQFSRYCNGRSDTRPEVLVKILSVFPDHAKTNLLRAYLLDQTPREYVDLLEIVPATIASDSAVCEPQAATTKMPLEIRNALQVIVDRCHERPVYDLVIDLAKLLDSEFARSISRAGKSLSKESSVDPAAATASLVGLGDRELERRSRKR